MNNLPGQAAENPNDAQTDAFDYELVEPQLDGDDEEYSEQDHRLAAVVAELTDRLHRGEELDLADVCREHPELAAELRMLWGTLVVAQAAGKHDSENADRIANRSGSDSGCIST